VEKALKRGKSLETAESYRASIESGKRQLWQLETDGKITGVVISEVYAHPDGETVALTTAACVAFGLGSSGLSALTAPWTWSLETSREEGREQKPVFEVKDLASFLPGLLVNE
jgi:hypothetical protein